MKNKRIFALLTVLALLLCLLPAVSAAALPRLCDNADLLSPAEEMRVQAALDAVSIEYGMDIVIVTVASTDGASPRDYADDFFDYNGYGTGSGRDGMLLLISMAERDWYISTSGACIDIFSDGDLDSIGYLMLDDLGDGDYADAFEVFIDECAYIIQGAVVGYPFDVGSSLVVSLVVGLVAALIGTGKMKADLKTVRQQHAAAGYVRENSMKVTESQDIFLYRNVARRERANETNGSSSRHISSSGRSHGGRGGKF